MQDSNFIGEEAQQYELNLIYRFCIHLGIQDYESYSFEHRWDLVNKIFPIDQIYHKVLFDFLKAFEQNCLVGNEEADKQLQKAGERLVNFCKSNRLDIDQLLKI